MARTIADIQTSMDTAQAAETNLSTLNSTSQTAIYTLWKNIVATVANYLEQLMDTKKAEIETILANNVFGGTTWLRNKVLEFQYDATTPQVIQLIDNIPQYPVVDETKRIVTNCSIQTSSGVATVLVAKNYPAPEKLTTPEKDALSSYLNAGGTAFGGEIGIGVVGVLYSVVSLDPDRLYLKADIYYSGQYANTIQTDVLAKLNEYMANLTFGGDVVTTSLVDYLQDVPGFSDIIINDLAIRDSATAWASRTSLTLANETLLKSSTTIAGYIIEEDTATRTFTDELTFIAV